MIDLLLFVPTDLTVGFLSRSAACTDSIDATVASSLGIRLPVLRLVALMMAPCCRRYDRACFSSFEIGGVYPHPLTRIPGGVGCCAWPSKKSRSIASSCLFWLGRCHDQCFPGIHCTGTRKWPARWPHWMRKQVLVPSLEAVRQGYLIHFVFSNVLDSIEKPPFVSTHFHNPRSLHSLWHKDDSLINDVSKKFRSQMGKAIIAQVSLKWHEAKHEQSKASRKCRSQGRPSYPTKTSSW